jgi:murein DD-endopeptidase MepM/ murein hydrolase activator NlpD
LALVLGPLGLGPRAGAAHEFDVSVSSIAELTGLTAVVAHSDNGVHLRAKPGQDGEILDSLPDGTVVALRIDEADTVYGDDGTRWWPVRSNGEDGWIAGFYLDDAGGASPSDGESAASASSFGSGDYVAAQSDDGTGLNIRSGAGKGFERIASLADGDVVQVMDGPTSDDNGDGWYLVTDGDVTGYAFAGFLVAASQPAAPAKEPTHEDLVFSIGDYVTAAGGKGVNIRHRGFVGSDVIASFNGDDVLQVVGQATFDDDGLAWYKVDDGDARGYVLGDLLVGTVAPPPPPPPAAPSGPTGSLSYPLSSYVLTQGYGCTDLSIEPYDANLGCNFHNGVDLAAPAYTPILAADGGTVTAAGWCDCGLGYYVEIDHGNGFSTEYGHMAEQPYVSVGQVVNKGDVIGPVGSTGASTGPHTHFIVMLNGSTVNPLDYLSG